MRLIDADRFNETLTKTRAEFPPLYALSQYPYIACVISGLMSVADLLDKEPTVDPVKHGYWIFPDNPWDLAKCSVCGKRSRSGVWADENLYCPCCGAKMDGEPNEICRCR